VIATALRYWNTLKYLRPVQLYGRIWFRTYRPRPDLSPAPPVRPRLGHWVNGADRPRTFVGPSRFTFLNETHDIDASRWDDPALAKLWRYNLHYFDDLAAADANERTAEQRALLDRWIQENPPGQGTPWEPYPTSLRIVNWIKWALAGNGLLPAWEDHLAAQARFLAGRLEHHLLGNHLLANAKALAFAGAYFSGKEADRWLARANTLLDREIPEQILSDGGHFERSPMYHALALEDLLDLVNLARVYPDTLTLIVAEPDRLRSMVHWLLTMTHPDGEIGFFNDAAFGIAPRPSSIVSYAGRLGIVTKPLTDASTTLEPSGYVRLLEEDAVVIVDVGPVGPDYIPGHAHADTLSFELSVGTQRVFVNGGTSRYVADRLRLAERGTAAHNTVSIDDTDSSEVWGAFRVARRARPLDLRVSEAPTLTVSAAHDGYRRLSGSPIHRRSLQLDTPRLVIEDRIEGEFRSAAAFLHVHPAFVVTSVEPDQAHLRGPNLRVSLSFAGGTVSATSGHWSPEFGRREAAPVLRVTFVAPAMRTEISWEKE
jgi:uncharacterized heparinase superfamily protein